MRLFRHPRWQHLDYRVKVATTQENKPPTQGTRQWTFTTPRWRCGSILLPSLNARVPEPTGGCQNWSFSAVMVTKTVQHQCHNHIGFLLINSGPDQVKHDTVSASYNNIPQDLIRSRCGQVVSKWPSFHWKHTKPKAISTTKMASPHDQLNSFSIPVSVSSTKCSMIQNT